MDTSSGQSPPPLSPGTHLSPEDGTCLMEAVALAADLPFSDSPACTPALLAHLARLVNDTSTEAGRQSLSPLVPALLASQVGGLGQTARVSAQVALACTTFGLSRRPTLLLSWLQRRAAREVRLESQGRPPAEGGVAAHLGRVSQR